MVTLNSIFPQGLAEKSFLDSESFLDSILIRTNFSLGIRTALGWRGLHPAIKNGKGWTCKINGKAGVYGIQLKNTCQTADYHKAAYRLSYFPMPDEDIREDFAFETALLTCLPDYMEYVRSFLCYPDFTKHFGIADIEFIFPNNDRDTVICSLIAVRKLRTYAKEGIYRKIDGESICLVEKGDVDQNLPAYDLAFAFFEVLGSTLTFNLEAEPLEMFYSDSAARNTAEDDNKTETINLVYANKSLLENNEAGLMKEGIKHSLAESAMDNDFKNAAWWEKTGPKQGSDNKFIREAERPQLVILTGFLGSGKTSFLKHFIEYHTQNNRFTAVIQNEIGEKGLDAGLLEDEFGVMEMDEGCVCCSLIGQLRKGIQHLADNYKPDVIILETTGLANPFNLLDEINEVSDIVRFDNITTMVDAENFNSFLEETEIAESQVKAADVVLINKSDLVSDQELKALREKIHRINPHALLSHCVEGDINPALIYSADSDDAYRLEENMKADKTNHNHLHEAIGSIKMDINKPVRRKDFEEFIKNLPSGIFRSKGWIQFKDEEQASLFQYVNGRYDLENYQNKNTEEKFIIFIGKNDSLTKINHCLLN